MANKEKCVACNKVSVKEMLRCKACDSTCHIKCAGISENTFKEIQGLSNFSWNCDECLKVAEVSRMDGLFKKIDVIGNDIKTLMGGNKEMVNNVKVLIDDVKLNGKRYEQKLGDDLKGFKSDIKGSWADVVREEVRKNVDVVSNEVKSISEGMSLLKKEVTSTKEKVQSGFELEEKAGNILIFRLQESDKKSYQESRKEDFENIMIVLKTITNDKICDSDVIKFYRLGKRGEQIRPILIKFNSITNKNLVMDNLSNCSRLDESFRKIGIGYDMTKEQREEYKKLIVSAKEKETADKENFLYRVRGVPGNLRIVRFVKRQNL